jgi:hydrogenase maturation protein HypF
MDELERRRLRIDGIVQGVGFRPFVHRLALELDVTGVIGNDDDGVWCEVQGPAGVLDRLVARLRADAPPLSRIESISQERVPATADEREFRVAPSASAGAEVAPSIPPDVAPCAVCRAELHDPADRRSGYPFTCCTDCGPRYTVVRAMPYDRERTAMAEFPLCAACATEYATPGDRRHHAQATCCPTCGPTPTWRAGDEPATGDHAIEHAARALAAGRIVALKGVGGYQLLCRADDAAAVDELRARKQRWHKPFAVLVPDLAHARALGAIDPPAERALTGPEAPIVLVERHAGATSIAPGVAPDSTLLGLMLPGSPLHLLVVERVGLPLVCTSGNLSDEPIAIDDADAIERLGGIADGFLAHDRTIERRADDSVGQLAGDAFQVLRRARGFAPAPIRLADDGPSVLGVGAMLKNTVCLALGHDAHVSVHLGDLDHPLAIEAFERAIDDLLTVTRSSPDLLVHDLHPEYVSTKLASVQDLAPTHGVQHHHAHLVSCLAEHRRSGPAIGVTFDGFGWGTDGTLWGGEFLVGDASGFQRAAHVTPIAVPGGESAVRDVWRMALAHLDHAFAGALPDCDLVDRHRDDVEAVLSVARSAQTVETSSVGRLFDAVAALCGIADVAHYEGQAAIRLEQTATASDLRLAPWDVVDGDAIVLDPGPVVRSVVDALTVGRSPGAISDAFHRSLADVVATTCSELRDRTGVGSVALSGGVFQNRRLSGAVRGQLTDRGFEVLEHRVVPPNDGGISLGQVVVGRAEASAD